MGASLPSQEPGSARPRHPRVGLKTVLQPLVVWTWSITSDRSLVRHGHPALGMPTGVNDYLFGTRYQVGVAVAATAICFDALSLLTVSVICAPAR
jgi:hypothetical protein